MKHYVSKLPSEEYPHCVATPITLRQYASFTRRNLAANENGGAKGYLVVQHNGQPPNSPHFADPVRWVAETEFQRVWAEREPQSGSERD